MRANDSKPHQDECLRLSFQHRPVSPKCRQGLSPWHAIGAPQPEELFRPIQQVERMPQPDDRRVDFAPIAYLGTTKLTEVLLSVSSVVSDGVWESSAGAIQRGTYSGIVFTAVLVRIFGTGSPLSEDVGMQAHDLRRSTAGEGKFDAHPARSTTPSALPGRTPVCAGRPIERGRARAPTAHRTPHRPRSSPPTRAPLETPA